jgi:hypothetical protein
LEANAAQDVAGVVPDRNALMLACFDQLAKISKLMFRPI